MKCQPYFMPNQQEIAAACAEIQRTWTHTEERQRRLGPGDSRLRINLRFAGWTAPVVHGGRDVMNAIKSAGLEV